MSLLLALIIIVVLFLISAALVILVIGPLILLQPQRRTKEWYRHSTNLLEPRDAGLPQEDMTVTTSDGLKLSCWWVSHQRRARGTIIYLHGVGDCKTAGVPLSRLLYRHGYNIFLYDSRQHGESEGSFCTYGFYEKYDVSTVIDSLATRRNLKIGSIGIFGTSMGAAVAIQAAAIDDRITAVVAEASFTDLRTISVDYQRRIAKLPWHFLRNVAMSRSQRIANFKAKDVSPLEDVKNLRVPILFIHGMEDKFIHYEYSKVLYHVAREPKELFLVPGASHTDVWEISGKGYEHRILSFFDRYMA